MDSRGRALVKLCCQLQESSTKETGIINVPVDLAAEKDACDFLLRGVNVADYESAPPSIVNPVVEIDTIIEPRSAPLPINQETSPLTLTKNGNNQVVNILEMNGNQLEDSSPVRGSPISGIELLSMTEAEPFSDSESSWVADTDESKKYGRKRKSHIIQSDSFDSSDTILSTKKPEKKRRKRLTKKVASRRKIHTKAIIEIPNNSNIEEEENSNIETDSVLVNAEVSVPYKPYLTIDETDCEITTNEIIEEEQLDSNQKKVMRWKKSIPTKWKREVEKKKKSNCLPYIDKNGKIHEAKLPKVTKCDMFCRYKCSENFTEEERLEICKEYWEIRDFKQQKEFLIKHIILKPVRRTLKNLPIEKQRATSREYRFIKKYEFIQVCKTFFMATLSISSGPIETAVKNINERGSFSGIDKRGKRAPANKISEDRIKEVKTHIESFAVKDSHYCRKKTTCQYLDEHLSISKMYELYKQNMKEMQKEPVKINVYKRVFGTNYNLSFFHPKKDQCGLCNKYIRTHNPEEALKKEYSEHIERKEASFKSKDIDKKKSEEDPTFLCVTMDLQSLLQIPSTADSLMYYSRKLNLYNLSVYEFKPPNNNAHCLIWTEINGKRGSIEIASAINAWIKKIPEEVSHVTFYSDTCSGQNRNQYMSAYLLHLVQTNPKLSVVEQKYLESGHSFMEVDSMHSAIEKEKRFTEVYSIIDWKGIMNRARSTRHNKNVTPYNVFELCFNDMIDVKLLAGKVIKNRNICTEGKKVNWLKIKCLRFEKQFPGIIKFRYGYDGPYMSIDTSCTITGRMTRRTTMPMGIDIAQEELKPAYENPLPITEAKKKDLLNLCRKNIIPAELHAWYGSLPSSNTKTDDLQSENDSD